MSSTTGDPGDPDVTRRDAPRHDALGTAVRAGADMDPIEVQMAMQRVRSRLRSGGEEDPVRIDRYLVVRRIAAGGFGVVYEGYDPELDRKVAIKVLHGSDGASGQLLSEARTLAQVAHPNVVAVYDVGVVPDPAAGTTRIFLAMELVEGQTLRQYLAGHTQAWQQVVQYFRAAGAGLAAAHAKGVIHRDFKPANVLIGPDGRARVADFGLAITEQGADPMPSGSESGTPRYMAPEQHRGEACDARTDVYAFCVSLYEGLHGRAPFAGTDLSSLRAAKEGAQLPPASKPLPGWLHKVLHKGLMPDPAQRYGGMDDLLADLDKGLSRRRRSWAAMTVVASVALGGGYALAPTGGGRLAACQSEASAALHAVWNSSTQEQIQAAFDNTGAPYARTAWSQTNARLADVGKHWQTVRVDACEAQPALEKTAPAVLEHRLACLEEQLQDLSALVQQLGQADAKTVERSVHATYSLPDLEACLAQDISTLAAAEPMDSARQLALEDLRADLARLRSLRLLGHYAEADALAGRVVEQADLEQQPRTATEALFEAALTREAAGHREQAVTLLQSAARRAEQGRLLSLTARTKSHLVYLVGHLLGRKSEGRIWAENADSAIAHAEASGADVRGLLAQYNNSLAAIEYSEGNYDAALERYTASRDLWTQLHGSGHPSVIRATNNLGSVHFSRGEIAQARDLYQEVYEARIKTLGESHPDVAMVLSNLGSTYVELGDLDGALQRHQRVLEIREKSLPADHPDLARAHHQLGLVLGRLGELDPAREHHEIALAIQERTMEPDHPDIASSHNSLGSVVDRAGGLDEALRHYEQAMAMVIKRSGADHPTTSLIHSNIGDVARRQGNLEAARASHEKAVAAAESAGKDHPWAATGLTGLGRDLIAAGSAAQAILPLERALQIHALHKAGPNMTAEIHMALGQAHHALGQPGARDEVVVAAKALAENPGRQVEAREARAWLDAHPE